MARTLPWLKQPSRSTSKSRPTPASTSSLHSNVRRDPGDIATNPSSPPHANTRVPRDVSSSPPPIQPRPMSPLRPGLQADDIYIMVEDEFLATAQMFTKHRHRAVYQDMRRQAKERAANAAADITRPTDGTTSMGHGLKQRKKAEAIQRRMELGMEELLQSAANKRSRCSDESDSDFDVNRLDPPDDGWRGTHLHRFVMSSPEKGLQSLVGIQRVKSHTRAAAGFATARIGLERDKEAEAASATDDNTTDTDDLDGPAASKHYKPLPGAQTLQTREGFPPAVSKTSFEPREQHAGRTRMEEPETSNHSAISPRSRNQRSVRNASTNFRIKSPRTATLQARKGLERYKDTGEGRQDVGRKIEEIPLF